MSEKDWDAYVVAALAASRRIRVQVDAEYVQYMNDRIAAVTAERDAMSETLRSIGDYAHDQSTGPAVPDALWEIRSMAYDALRGKEAS